VVPAIMVAMTSDPKEATVEPGGSTRTTGRLKVIRPRRTYNGSLADMYSVDITLVSRVIACSTASSSLAHSPHWTPCQAICQRRVRLSFSQVIHQTIAQPLSTLHPADSNSQLFGILWKVANDHNDNRCTVRLSRRLQTVYHGVEARGVSRR